MSELFNRDISVQIGTTLITSRTGEEDVTQPTLRMAFKVEKALKGEPNTADLQIWNLAEKTRAKFQEEKIPVIIEAGYVGNTSQIFSGDMSYGASSRQGPDWITRFQAGDGEAKYRSARINENFKPGVKLREVFKKAVKATGLGLGNVIKKADEGDFRGAYEELTNGAVLSGNAADIADRLAKSLGFEYQIRDGQQEVFRADETTEETTIRLEMESGLIGVPELGEKGAVRARSLLQGGLFPARKVEIIARRTGEFGFEINGFFKIYRAVHTGDTWGGDWYSDIEAMPVPS